MRGRGFRQPYFRSLLPHALAVSAMRNVCFGYVCRPLLSEPAPSVAFITGTMKPPPAGQSEKTAFRKRKPSAFQIDRR